MHTNGLMVDVGLMINFFTLSMGINHKNVDENQHQLVNEV